MIDVILGGFASITFMGVGYLIGKRSRRTKVGGVLAPFCMCRHGYSSHDGGYRCEFTLRDRFGDSIGQCPCTVYVGPDPVLSGHWIPPAKEKDLPKEKHR